MEKEKGVNLLKNKFQRLDKKTMLAAIGVLAGIVLFVISVLHFNSYKLDYELQTIHEYWEKTNSKSKAIYNGNQMIFSIPDNVMSTEMTLAFKKLSQKTRYKLSGAMLDSEDKTILFDGTLYGVSFPIKGELSYKLFEGSVVAEIKNIIIAKTVMLNEKNSEKLMKWLFSDSYPIIFDGKNFFENEMLLIKDMKWKDSLFEVTIELKEGLLLQELKEIQKNINQIILEQFKEKGNEKEKLAVSLVEKEQLQDEDKEMLYKEVFMGGDIVAGILTICNQEHATKVFAKYKNSLFPIEEAKIKEKREVIIYEGLAKYRNLLEDALNNKYFSGDKPYINKNKVFSVEKKEYPTPQILNSKFNLQIPKDISDRMNFYYEKNSKSILLTYKLDEQSIMVMDKKTYKTLGKGALENDAGIKDTGRVSVVKDKELWDGIYKQIQLYYQEEAPFIRYMKADDKYAFVIASPSGAYQSFNAFAMIKEENVWKLLKDSINNIKELNEEFPEFNLETATIEIETVKIFQLEEDMLQVMIEDMINKKIATNITVNDIVFCSYGNDYISIKVSDGKEYVYKVFRMYLHTIYPKDQAIKSWTDLPEIITLQEKPVP